jgi:hypothetical protein
MRFSPPFRGTMEYAACSTSNPGKKWRISAIGDRNFFQDIAQMTRGGNYGGGLYFDLDEASEMDALGDGTFLFAVLIDGVRCSNVIRVKIQHDYNAKAEPPLRVFAIQPLKGDTIQQLGVWVVPPVLNEKLTNFVASAVDLSIDGTWHTTSVGIWTGPVSPLKPWESAGENCYFENYVPPIVPFKHAKVQARLLDYTSAVTDLSFDPSDTRQFDRAFNLN